MRTYRLPTLAAVLLGLSACVDFSGPRSAPSLTVMTRNVYIGFDADAAVAALASGDPTVYGPVLQQAVVTLQRTDFVERANMIVDEIAAARPHAVGLQEVYHIHADLVPLGMPDTIDLDYLAILQNELAQRHLPYRAVATVTDTDMQPLPGIELVDRDVLLIDTTRVTVHGGVRAQTFANNIGVLAAGIDKKAGYVMAQLDVDGRTIALATTHLESDLDPSSHAAIANLRALQIGEIDTAAMMNSGPSIVLGDLNDHAGSPMYNVSVDRAYTDTWASLEPGQNGYSATCFASADLSDSTAACSERIDMVFEKGFGLGGASIRLVGISAAIDRRTEASGYLWPSDHAGVVATYQLNALP